MHVTLEADEGRLTAQKASSKEERQGERRGMKGGGAVYMGTKERLN